jgi:hypothetical protein
MMIGPPIHHENLLDGHGVAIVGAVEVYARDHARLDRPRHPAPVGPGRHRRVRPPRDSPRPAWRPGAVRIPKRAPVRQRGGVRSPGAGRSSARSSGDANAAWPFQHLPPSHPRRASCHKRPAETPDGGHSLDTTGPAVPPVPEAVPWPRRRVPDKGEGIRISLWVVPRQDAREARAAVGTGCEWNKHPTHGGAASSQKPLNLAPPQKRSRLTKEGDVGANATFPHPSNRRNPPLSRSPASGFPKEIVAPSGEEDGGVSRIPHSSARRRG